MPGRLESSACARNRVGRRSWRALALAALLGAAATGAAGQTGGLRADPATGRLIVTGHDPAAGWTMRKTDRQTEIRLPGLSLAKGAAEGLALPALGGIAAVAVRRSAEGSTLLLTLDCACAVAVGPGARGTLAIAAVPAETPPSRPDREARLAPPPDMSPRPVARGGPSSSRPGPPDGKAKDRADPDLARVRARLVSQLERAAAAGLITLDAPEQERGPASDPAKDPPGVTRSPAAGNPVRPEAPTGPPAQPQAPDDAMPPPDEDGASSASDAPSSAAAPTPDPIAGDASPSVAEASSGPPAASGPAVTSEAPACRPDADFALPIAPRAAAAEELARLRGRLLGEFDRPRIAAAQDLARFYIGLGFAPEARAVLETFAAGAEDTRHLSWMADVAAGLPPRDPAAGPAEDCTGLHALWQAAAAAASGQPRRALALARRAGRAQQLAPPPLGPAFAIRLGHAAADLGDWASARRQLALAARGRPHGSPAPSAELHLEARIALAAGRIAEGIGNLRRLWARFPGAPGSGEALIALADRVLAGDVPGAADTGYLRRDLASLALMARGTPLAARAAAAEARLTARSYGRAAGMDLLALHQRQGTLEGDAYPAAVSAIAGDGLAGQGQPPLALLFERTPDRYAPVLDDPAFRSSLALSFARIGQPARAEDLLEPEDRAVPRIAETLARSYLAAGQSAAAAAIAARLPDGPARAEIMAAVFEDQGMPARALAALEAAGPEAGTPAMRARLAWAAGDWDAAAAALAEMEDAAPDPAVTARRALAEARAGAVPAALPDIRDGNVAPYLERVDRELELIREVLADG